MGVLQKAPPEVMRRYPFSQRGRRVAGSKRSPRNSAIAANKVRTTKPQSGNRTSSVAPEITGQLRKIFRKFTFAAK
jgi:hypothetical protein